MDRKITDGSCNADASDLTAPMCFSPRYLCRRPFDLVIIFPSLRRSLPVRSHEFLEKRDGSAEGRSFYANRIAAREESWNGRCIGTREFTVLISPLHLFFFLFLLREERRITRRRRRMIFISLNSFHGPLASNARIR